MSITPGPQEFSFTRYLLSKQSIDDRSLNQHTYQSLLQQVWPDHIRIIEVGAGIGTMLARLLRWGFLHQAEYLLMDEMEENISFAKSWLPQWAQEHGFTIETQSEDSFRLRQGQVDIDVKLIHSDLFEYSSKNSFKADLLIAHALLDLLPMPQSLNSLFSFLRPGGLAWFTINFDGVTALEPAAIPALDQKVEELYHQSMDMRPSGGDSKSGRHLFTHLIHSGAEILASGSSDWVVFPQHGAYPAEEKYFLQSILHFFEDSLRNHPALNPQEFTAWLKKRHEQIEKNELVYIAHQVDFLVKTAFS